MLAQQNRKQMFSFKICPFSKPNFFCVFARSLQAIDEGSVASKSPHKKFGYFLSMSLHAVSADITPNSAVGIFSPKTEGTLT
jgi:hypothetical protein